MFHCSRQKRQCFKPCHHYGSLSNPPPTPGFSSYPAETVLTASPVNVHGKSTFHLRWQKSDDDVEYYVYRALDTSLFTLDNQRRENTDTADYNQIAISQFDPAVHKRN